MEGTIVLPNWKRVRGKDLFKNFIALSDRPNVAFIQGDGSIQDDLVHVVDSVISAIHTINTYGIEVSNEADGNDMAVIITESTTCTRSS